MKKYFIVLGIIITLIVLISMPWSFIASGNKMENNTKIEWGLVRGKKHEQPTFTKKHVDIINKYNGIYIGNKEQKYIYLTFDLGYENGYTSNILDTLKSNNVKATFFITGDYITGNEEIIMRIIDEGHILGNHSQNHHSLPTLNSEEKVNYEITCLHEKIKEQFNYEMTYFRPPKGEYSDFTARCIQDLGYINVMWSFAYDDWDTKKQKGNEYAKTKILDNIHPGSILLLHAVSKDNAEVLDTVIKEVITMGYEWKNLKDFVR